MTDSQRALEVLRELRDELAHNPAIGLIVGNAIDIIRDLSYSRVWELDDVAEEAARAVGDLDDADPVPVKLPSRTALRAVPRSP